MEVFLIAYLLAALGVAVFLLLGRRTSGNRRQASWPSPLDAPKLGSLDMTSPTEVGTAIAVALDRLRPTLEEHGSRIDVAVRPGLMARIPGHELANAVQDTLAEMLERPNHRMLLSAIQQGGQIAITLADDVPGPDAAPLHAALLPLASRIALRGGALSVGTAGGQGATVTIRLAAMPRGQAAPAGTELAHPMSPQRPDVARAV